MSLPVASEWLRANVRDRPIGVDRDAGIIRGYVVAQAGPFKTAGRGEFDRRSLQAIVAMGNAAPAGLKSRFAHPSLSDDGIGKFLGRARAFSLGMSRRATDDGQTEVVDSVRADLHLDRTAFNTPSGNLGGYVLDLAESDADALSSSLVLQVDWEYRLNDDGTRTVDADGEPLPPLWRPTKLHASDIVDNGDAVDGLLSAQLDPDCLPDRAVRRGAELLDRAFSGQPRDVVEARCLAWLARYLDGRYGPADRDPNGPDLATLRRRLRQKALDFLGDSL